MTDRYTVSEEVEGSVLLRDARFGAEAHICPQFGANCVQFRTSPQEAPGSTSVDLLVAPEHVSDLANQPFHGGWPVLFPFPNRVRNGEYQFDGRSYSMARLLALKRDRGAGQAIHGLVADRRWTAEAKSTSGEASVTCTLQLDDDPEIFEQYPFPCRVDIAYSVAEGRLHMQTRVTNTGTARLPMGFGIHPWFPTSLHAGGPGGAPDQAARASAEVLVPTDSYWELDHLMPTGRILPVTREGGALDFRRWRALNGLSLDHVFTGVQRDAGGWSWGGMRDRAAGLELILGADSAFRDWVLYAPTDRPVIALEPYTCTTDAINLQPQGIDAGLIVLDPGQTWKGEITLHLQHAAPDDSM